MGEAKVLTYAAPSCSGVFRTISGHCLGVGFFAGGLYPSHNLTIGGLLKFSILTGLVLLSLKSFAAATILSETRTNDVNKSSTHLICELQDMGSAKFASYSRIVIKTDFGDDGPTAQAYDAKGSIVETAVLGDFSEHERLSMRIFEIEDYEAHTLVNLVVVYAKENGKIVARGVLTSNGQENPVVNAAEMTCRYVGKLAINN